MDRMDYCCNLHGVYMTRLVAMTFWGKEKFLDGHKHTPGHEVHGGDHPTPAHAHTPHESPPSMWVPLVALAVLATIGGFVGVGPAFKFLSGSDHPGGRLNIVNYLDPIIWLLRPGNLEKTCRPEHQVTRSEPAAQLLLLRPDLRSTPPSRPSNRNCAHATTIMMDSPGSRSRGRPRGHWRRSGCSRHFAVVAALVSRLLFLMSESATARPLGTTTQPLYERAPTNIG